MLALMDVRQCGSMHVHRWGSLSVVLMATCAVYLHQCVFPELVAGESGCGPKEARVRHLLHCLPNGEHQSSIHEGHHNVSIKIICATKKERKEPLTYSQPCS